MRTRRAWLCLSVLLAVGCAFQQPPASYDGTPRPLRILATNDDGVNAAGLRALREALLAAGHRVVVVAPSQNQSGRSVSITTGGSVSVRELEPEVYAVDGTPADCVLVGLRRVVKGPVDLVVSGINFGQNVGHRTVASGTVGATIAAGAEGVPAVAFSQAVDPRDVRDTAKYFPAAAEVAVALVDVLARQPGRLLPPGVILNVNHPARMRGELSGVRMTRQGRSILYDLNYTREGDHGYRVTFVPSEQVDPVPDADTTALAEGYVSVTPLDGSWTATEAVLDSLDLLAGRVAPGLPASPDAAP